MMLKLLSEKVEFLFYEKHRKILNEGHRAECMYFIVNGEILVKKKLYSKSDDQILDRPVNIISAGDCFGHVSLIYNTPRNATCISHSKFIHLAASLNAFECFFVLCRRICINLKYRFIKSMNPVASLTLRQERLKNQGY